MDPGLKNVPIIPGFVKLSFDFQPKLALLPVHLSLFSSFLKGLTNDTLRAGGKEMERGRERAWQRRVQANWARENAENERLNRCGRASG